MKSIQKNVKTPQNQISMKWVCKSMKEYLTYCHYYMRIHCLTFSVPSSVIFIPCLDSFSTIINLSLSQINNKSLSGLAGSFLTDSSNLQVLSLYNCRYLEDVSEVSKILTLRKMSITVCTMLLDISCLANIQDVTIDTVLFVKKLSYHSGKNQDSLHLMSGSEINFSQLFSFRHLTNLSLDGSFHPSCDFITIFGEQIEKKKFGNDEGIACNVKVLHITNFSCLNAITMGTIASYNFPAFPQIKSLTSVSLFG
jgi:hypothetical protein